MEIKAIPQLETEFEGVAITVPNAQVSECPVCGEATYSAKELRRWKEIKQATLAEADALPNGEEVKKVRGQLGLSVAEFASLIAVTRQTVHSWERASDQPMKLGPAALLVSLLKHEQRRRTGQLAVCLSELASLRGSSITVESPETSEAKPRDEKRTRYLRRKPRDGAASWKRAA